MKAVANTKKFVSAHKTAIAVGATIVVCVVIHRGIAKQWNEFLTTNNLLEAFYNPEI
jgi:hypothetical protein